MDNKPNSIPIDTSPENINEASDENTNVITNEDVIDKLDDIAMELRKNNRQNNVFQITMLFLILPMTIIICYVAFVAYSSLSQFDNYINNSGNSNSQSSTYKSALGL